MAYRWSTEMLVIGLVILAILVLALIDPNRNRRPE
jgi:hypothetical protein